MIGQDTAARGESAKQGYEYLSFVYQENEGVLTSGQITNALLQVSQPDGKWTTQWSIVYGQNSLTASYYFDSNYTTAYRYIQSVIDGYWFVCTKYTVFCLLFYCLEDFAIE